MPYKTNEDLPEEVKKLPYEAQTMFRKAFNRVDAQYNETIAFKTAWEIVKKRFKKVDGGWVAKGMGFTLYSFETENQGNVFVQKGDDGEYFIEAVLSDDMFDNEGNRFTPQTLENYANQINEFGISGFITHKDWKDFCLQYSHLPEDAFVQKARERQGILKSVKAIYEKGKLWIKAMADKRYVNRIKEFNKLSIEALVPKRFQKGKEFDGGYVLGFALDNNAINPRAKVVKN